MPDEPGMTLQFRNLERDRIVWRDYTVDGEVVKSPVDFDVLPAGVYRLVIKIRQSRLVFTT